jgi:hypothetical protein
MRGRALLLLSIIFSAPGVAGAQRPFAPPGDPAATMNVATATAATATRATEAPVIDGREDDAVWQHAQLIDSFRQSAPSEDKAPSFRTTAKVAYDDRYLYVFVRAYDPHPDSIIALLSRRDVHTQSERLKVIIDSYHDRRTGYEFAVNPLGVRRDTFTFNDEIEDDSWDGVWDVATRVDSAGWTAEFRIPFNQLRFAPQGDLTMGFGISRDIARLNERDSWPMYRKSKPGIASQLGELSGLRGLGTPRHLEILPYVVTKNVTYASVATATDTGFARRQEFAAGADIKYGVTSNLTLDATVNPDFGQVESDPATLNLSNFETYYGERRPFFVEGTGIFRFDINCPMMTCSGLFYSRRIGRQPQLTDAVPGSATTTEIIGAAKLTGRLSGGLNMGFLEAATTPEYNHDGSTSEPRTNYLATRLIQENRDGTSAVGLMATAVNRSLDTWTAPYLRSDAYTGGVDYRYRTADRKYELKAYVAGSYVAGSDSAMDYTQLSSTHNYQRPGSGLVYDSTRTSLTGDAEKVEFSKIGGGAFRYYTGISRVSPGFEINDMGYLQVAGKQAISNWFWVEYHEPRSFYRSLFAYFSQLAGWTTEGLSIAYMNAATMRLGADVELKNSWMVHLGVTGDNLMDNYDDRKARGGPALFHHPVLDWEGSIAGDPRWHAVPSLAFSGYSASNGHSHGYGLDPQVLFTFSSSLAVTLGLHYDLGVNYAQWFNNYYPLTDSAVYTFATLHQNTASATIRFDATFTPKISLQFYAQPYISDGQYTNWRYLAEPRSKDFATQFQPYTMADSAASDHNFTYQQLNVNTVFRWEYRRGSSLYVVWTHGRSAEPAGQQYTGFTPGTDVNAMFSAHPMNTFLIKISYWLSP